MINVLTSDNNTVQLAEAAVSRSRISPNNKELGQVLKKSIGDPRTA